MCSITRGDQGPGAVNAARGALATAAERAAGDGLRQLSHDELSRLVTDLRAAQAQAQSVLLSAVREVDTRGSCVVDGALTPAAWLRAHTRLQPRTAAAAVRTARALHSGEFPLTAAALALGEISPEQTREIAAIVDRVPAGTTACCRAPGTGHHTLLHEGGWTLQRQPEGRYLTHHRDGRVIGPEAHKPGHNRPPPRGHPLPQP